MLQSGIARESLSNTKPASPGVDPAARENLNAIKAFDELGFFVKLIVDARSEISYFEPEAVEIAQHDKWQRAAEYLLQFVHEKAERREAADSGGAKGREIFWTAEEKQRGGEEVEGCEKNARRSSKLNKLDEIFCCKVLTSHRLRYEQRSLSRKTASCELKR